MAFTISKNFHIIHMTDDLKALDAWYYDVFSVQRFMPESYMPTEVRDASLVLIGTLCVEPLAPAFRVEGCVSENVQLIEYPALGEDAQGCASELFGCQTRARVG